MTTPAFSALASPIARAQAAVRERHCPPPSLKPAADVQGAMSCPKCGGRLAYSAFTSGRTSGRCSSTGCVKWDD